MQNNTIEIPRGYRLLTIEEMQGTWEPFIGSTALFEDGHSGGMQWGSPQRIYRHHKDVTIGVRMHRVAVECKEPEILVLTKWPQWDKICLT